MKKPLVLIGGGGHCKSCIDVIRMGAEFEPVGIVEHAGFEMNAEPVRISGVPVIGTDDQLKEIIHQFPDFLITVGQIKTPAARITLFNTIRALGGHFPVVISPLAHVARGVTIREGTIIMHHALVNTEAVIGQNCIINTGALIEHESSVGDFVHISTKAIVNGQCIVGDRTLIGSGTVLANNVSVAPDSLVSAGSVVLKSLNRPGTYIGNPLRKIR